MADRGHELTEEILKEIEDRCADEYKIAAREMAEKYRKYMERFEAGRKEQYELWQAGKISKQDYNDWVYRHTMMGKRWEQMANTLAEDMHHTNEIAHGIANGQLPDIFALNANYGTYQIEHDGRLDTGFTLYNHDTAAYLMEDQQLMPGPSTRKAAQIAANKDMQWNYRKIQSAVLQGVLQGESPYEVANRLMGVAQMNYNAAVRYARTMGTNAQNAGRYESYHRAKNLGVDLKIEWSATLDGRTRHEHRLLDGQRRDVDEPFEVDGFKIMWPAQSSGPGAADVPQELIWNCRCTLLAWVKGFEGETVKSSPKMGELTYEEWKHEKEPKKLTQPVIDLTERRKSRLTEYRKRRSSPDFESMGREELIKYASENIKTPIDFKGAEESAVRGAVQALSRFEEAGGNIGNTKIVFGGTRGMYGLYDPKTDTIHLRKNDNFVEQLLRENERAILKLRKVQWIDPSYIGMFDHELGHAIDRAFGEEISREISANQDLLRKAFQISNYAATEPAYGSPRASEAVAENIAAYLAGGDKRAKIHPDIIAIIEKYLRRKR